MCECPICGDKFKSDHGVKVHAGRSHETSLAGETVECEVCGTDITRQPYEIREYENHFCSDGCEKKWRQRAFIGEQNPNCDRRATLECEHCGEEFEVALYRENSARFCSLDCKGEFESAHQSGSDSPAWEGGPATLTCDYCGNEYNVPPARKEESRFCSYECKGKEYEKSKRGKSNPSWSGGKEILKCEYCGKEYEVTPAKADKSRFCSYNCIGKHHQEVRSGQDSPSWQGGYEPYYGPNWRKQRQRRIIYDQARCQECGKTDPESLVEHGASLEVHHQTPFREFVDGGEANFEAANRLENLISLCKSCHSSVEVRRG